MGPGDFQAWTGRDLADWIGGVRAWNWHEAGWTEDGFDRSLGVEWSFVWAPPLFRISMVDKSPVDLKCRNVHQAFIKGERSSAFRWKKQVGLPSFLPDFRIFRTEIDRFGWLSGCFWLRFCFRIFRMVNRRRDA